ncbi:membrane integrity-associated transporter subunit PqiC [Cupriavidus sp. UGS-1]|uniref:PqiC family protein n=1 Tax=Cupriavidus sp. UGS-1 TaxID=2899826 RepID=UPI00351D102C
MKGPLILSRQLRAAMFATACAGTLLLGGCASSSEPRYYTLAHGAEAGAALPATAVPGAAALPAAATSTSQPLWIEVAPARVPERLNRQQIVIGGADGRVTPLDMARWSAPLPDEWRDALSQRLQIVLGAVDVYQQGLSGVQPLYRITTEVVRLDAQPGARVGATVNWTVRRLPDGRTLAGRTQAELPATGSGDDVAGVVAAMRQVVADTATQIAAGVASLQAEPATASRRP